MKLIKSTMKYVNTVQEYIDLYNSGYGVTTISVSEDMKENLISYIQGNKEKSNNIMNIYASWLLEGIYIAQNAKEAVSIFEKLSTNQDAMAQSNLGDCFYCGHGVFQDYKLASTYYLISAIRGYATAQYNLGICYEKGTGVKQDYKQAVYWYKKAADQEDATAQGNLGICYEKGRGVDQDYKQAVYWYEKAADQGDAIAQHNLGVCYYYGQGVDQDYKQAVYWYEKAADQGDAGAQNNLGNCYYDGQGVDQDYKQAVYWYEKAADQGVAIAQYNLGNCYLAGQGVEKSEEQAFQWYGKAAHQGYAEAQHNLGVCYYYGQGVEQDDKLAVYWYKKAADQEIAEAQYSLGNCYLAGRGVLQDSVQAVYWYKKAADQEHAGAQCNLGVCYRSGQGVDQDYNQALDWLLKSADQKYKNAYKQLSILYAIPTTSFRDLEMSMYYEYRAQGASIYVACYKVGQRIDTDENIIYNQDERHATAVQWYTRAAEHGNAYAQSCLGYHYEQGQGVEQDYEKAAYWYQKAKNEYVEAEGDYERVKSVIQTQKEKNVLTYSLNLKFCERKDVFISWNHNDIDIKNDIVDKLSQLNFNSVWESDGSGHGDLNDVIKDAILDSKAAIIILTKNSIKSDWVRQEVEWILKKTEKDPVYKATIKPLLISKSTQDLSKIINEFDDNNIFKKLINNYVCSFEVDIHVLKEFVEQSIDKVLKLQYKEKIINSLSSFKISLSSSLSDDNSVSGIIKSMISFENGYVNRMVYKDNKAYENFDLLKTDKPILIYGNGGVGKSLYLRNIIRKSFVDDNIFFYLEGRNIDDITEQYNLLEIIKKYSYDLYYPTYKDYVVATKFEDIFINHNKKYILIDALDEMPNKKLTILMGLIHKFKNKYDNVYFIFTSRNASNRDVLESTFENEVDLFELRSFTNEEIIRLYKNLATNLNKDVSELSFTNNLQDISEDVKNNPMLISNMIFIYLATNDFLKKRYDIIKKTVDMLIIDIEKRKNLNFKYEEYLINNLLSDLLGNLSMARANGDLRDTVDIFKEFLKDKIKQEHNLDVVAKEIDEYLTRRAIIVNGRVSHEIFSEYFISSCIFKEIYSLVSSNTGKKKIVMNQESFKDFMDDCFSVNDYPWTSITANFICKLDYEINAINGNRTMDESNNNCEAFDYTLKTGITNGGFSSSSIDVISDLLRKDSFYFNEFINKYYSK